MDFILGTDALGALFDAVLEITLRIAERELEAFGPEVDVVRCGTTSAGRPAFRSATSIIDASSSPGTPIFSAQCAN